MAKATVSFVTSADASDITIQADTDRNTDSLGNRKTAFLYGDTAYFRVYAENPDNVSVCATDGIITSHGVFYEDVADEAVTFIDAATASPEKPIYSLSSYSWAGKSLGDVTRLGVFSVGCALAPDPSAGLIGTAMVSYRSAYKLYGVTVSPKSVSEYPVTVYAGAKNG